MVHCLNHYEEHDVLGGALLMVREVMAAGLTISLIFTMTTGILLSSADPGGEPGPDIGEYTQNGASHALIGDHVTPLDEQLIVEAPPSASQITVNTSYIESELGPWASTTRFEPSAANATFPDNEATFMPLAIGPEPVFTWGAKSQIEFASRPMWVGVNNVSWGDGFELDLDDGNSSGQTIRISKSWLLGFGLDTPNFVHEDGTVVPTTESADANTIILDVPHFSTIYVEQSVPEVKGRHATLVLDHDGEVSYPRHGKLEIDVGQQSLDYDLLIPERWIKLRFGQPLVEGYDWTSENISGTHYYVVSLTPSQTPVTLIVTPKPWNKEVVSINMEDLLANLTNNSQVTLPLDSGTSLSFGVIANETPWPQHVDLDGNATGNDTRIRVTQDAEATLAGVRAVLFVYPDGLAGDLWYEDTTRTYTMGGTWVEPYANIEIWSRDNILSVHYDNEYPWNPPDPPSEKGLFGRTHLEPGFCSSFTSNNAASNHIGRAYDVANEMHGEYTGVLTKNYFAACLSNPIQLHPNTSLSICERLIRGFDDWLDDHPNGRYPYTTTGLYWVLISSLEAMLDPPGGCYGIARSDGVGVLAHYPDSVNYGLDDDTEFYRGRTSSRHMAALVSQETGHNWGEPDHPCWYNADLGLTFSVMCDQVQFDFKVDMWMDYQDPDMPPTVTPSADRVITGSDAYGN